MNTVLISSETVELLSLITGKRLNQKDITPPVVFLASLATILLGVIYADDTVAESEKERLLKSLSGLTQLAQAIASTGESWRGTKQSRATQS